MVRTRASTFGAASKIATGNYTGNGAATQAIVGVGFQPISLIIYANVDSVNRCIGFKIAQDGNFCHIYRTTSLGYIYDVSGDHIISLDADGFTVGDGTGEVNAFNINARVYTYIAFG